MSVHADNDWLVDRSLLLRYWMTSTRRGFLVAFASVCLSVRVINKQTKALKL